jgi:hypothetical protein
VGGVVTAPTKRRPNFFIVGAQKSGTSALSAWLGQHPQVFMSFPKEPGYLAFLERGYHYLDGYGREAPASEYVVKDESTYLKLFSSASPGQSVIAEASTWYFSVPGVAERIRNFNKDAKILVILRNPVDRAYSAWCHARRDKLEPCDEFSSALQKKNDRGEVEFLLRYQRMGMYSDSLAEYLSVFGAERVRVLLYEDLLGDQLILWKHLCGFLEIDQALEMPRQRRPNRSGQPRSRLVQTVLGSHRIKAGIRAIIPTQTAFWIKDRVDRMNLKRFPELDEDTRATLLNYYRQDIETLARMTGRDLSGWLE